MAYQCVELEKVKNIYGGHECKTWVESNHDYISPQIVGLVIIYALTLNLLVFGFKSMKQVMN